MRCLLLSVSVRGGRRDEAAVRWLRHVRHWAIEREREVLHPVGFSPERSLLLRTRVPFHLVLRLTARVCVAGIAPPKHRRRWYAATATSLAWDVLEAVKLSRNPGMRLGSRLVADLVDIAAWSSASPEGYASSPIVGAPLLTEATLRYSWLGVPLLAPHVVGVAAARRLAGKRVRPANLGNLLVAVGGGVGLRSVETARVQRIREDFDVERSSAETTARIAGRYRLTQQTYTVDGRVLKPHDRLSGLRLHFLRARSEHESVLHQMLWGGRKGALRELASSRALQLDTVLRAWKTDTNEKRTALADQVNDPGLPEEHGMTLISGNQSQALGRLLDLSRLRGDWQIIVVEATRPGARVVLDVAGKTLVLPPDPTNLLVTRGDPTPVAPLVGGVLWALLDSTEAANDVALWSVLPGAVAFGALADWSSDQIRERGEAAHGQIIRASFMAALLQATIVHLGIRGSPSRPDGSQRTPIQVALCAPAMIGGFCLPSLSPLERAKTALAFGAVLACGLAMLETPRWRRNLVMNFTWNATGFVLSLAYRLATEGDAERTLRELRGRIVEAAELAANEGEQLEWSLIEQACAEGLGDIDSVDPSYRETVEGDLRLLRQLAEERQRHG